MNAFDVTCCLHLDIHCTFTDISNYRVRRNIREFHFLSITDLSGNSTIAIQLKETGFFFFFFFPFIPHSLLTNV